MNRRKAGALWLALRLALHRREILRLRVPALRAKKRARDTSLRMTLVVVAVPL